MNIRNIISAIQEKRIRITDHADEETQADYLTFDEIFFSVLQGEVIEDYLSNAQDHADLERRLKTVDRIYGYHWNH